MKKETSKNATDSHFGTASRSNESEQKPSPTETDGSSGYDLWAYFDPKAKASSGGVQSVLSQIDQELQNSRNALSRPTPPLDGLEQIEQAIKKILTYTEQERERINRGSYGGALSRDAHSFSDEYISKLTHFIAIITKAIRFHGGMADPHCPSPFRAAVDLPENNQFANVTIEPDRIAIYLVSLPKKYAGYDDPIRQTLHARLYLCGELPRWERWSAAFIHVYPAACAINPNASKDVDNWSYKSVIDEITFALKTSDSAACFDYSATAVFTDELASGVYILVSEKTEKSFDFSFFRKAEPKPSKPENGKN